MEPSIKGSIVQVSIDELRDLVRRGVLDEGAIRTTLGAEAAQLALDQAVNVAIWYPVRIFDAVLRYLIEKVHGGRIEAMADAGRRTARNLIEKGLYAQLNRPADGRADPAFVRLIISLSKAIYNFTNWDLGSFDGESFEIVITDAAAYPDTLMWRNVGFVEVATSHATGESWTVACERPTPDSVRLRVTRAARRAQGA